MEVIHIIPASVLAREVQGSYKDTISRVRLLDSSEMDYRQVRVERDDPDALAASIPAGVKPCRFLIEYSHFPRITRELRRRWPQASIAVRTHNIEPLQHLDNHGWWPKRGLPWLLYGMCRLFLNDCRCKQYADRLFSINDWEDCVYWRRLPGKATVQWLPYYCPDHLIPHDPLPFEKRQTIACLPTPRKNRKSWDLVSRFCTFAEAMRASGSTYNFVVTGSLEDWPPPVSDAVEYVGFVKDLSAFMGTCRAVALLSPLGYGFKTTIADAFAASAHVIAHPGLVRHCPQSIRSALLPYDTKAPTRIDSVSLALSGMPTGHAIQTDQKHRNHDIVHSWLQD
jgi:hypothetical protein